MNYAIKDAANVTFYDKSTMTPVMYTDYLNTFSLDLSSEAIFAKAKGVNKIGFDGTMTGTVSTEAEVFELKYLSLLLGSDFVQGQNVDVAKREVFKVSDIKANQVTLKSTPVEGSVAVFNCDSDKRTQLGEISATESAKTVTLSTAPTSEYIVVYYMTSVPNSNTLTVSATGSGQNLVLIGETSVKDENGNIEYVQIKVCNCKVQQKIKLDLSATAVAKFTATFEILADENNNMVELALIGDEDEAPVIPMPEHTVVANH